MSAFFNGAAHVGGTNAVTAICFGKCAGFGADIFHPFDLGGQFVAFARPTGGLTKKLTNGPVIDRNAGS